MKTKVLFISATLVLLVLLGACAPSAAQPAQPNQVYVTGTGVIYVTPDIATIYIGVHTESQDVQQALQDNSSQAQAIASTLTEMGVDSKDIQTTAFNVYPQQEIGPQGEVTGTKYSVDNTVLVTIRDLSKLGQMLDAVVKSGANNINSIQFDVQDTTQAVSDARKLAVEDAKTQAQELADAAGVKLGKILSLSANQQSGPVPVVEGKAYAGMGGSAAPVAAGQLAITVYANITYEISQ
jgi:uncharacterized protein YggE